MDNYLSKKHELTEEILELINTHQEGGYWDFKREWYDFKNENKNEDKKKPKGESALLHDIICMANNLCNRDAYIVMGVDEEQDYSVIGIENDKNRRNTQKIIDFLKDKQFSGDIRPVVYVETICISKKTLDVIVIENSYNTPFYLKERFQQVCANNIYVRVDNTNTPINKSADINNVEYLWRKRFHLEDTPLKKISYYLREKDKWESSFENGCEVEYFALHPEYTIRHEDGEYGNAVNFYMLLYPCKSVIWHGAKLCYHHTVLRQLLYNSLAGGRCYVAMPNLGGISFRNHFEWDISYFYFCRNSLEYQFLFHLVNRYQQADSYQFNCFKKVVLLFEDDFEKVLFDDYLKNNRSRYEELYREEVKDNVPWFSYKIEGYDMKHLEKQYHDAIVLKRMLLEFRKSKSIVLT